MTGSDEHIGEIEIKKEVGIIKTKFRNKKLDRDVVQYIVKIPKRITTKMGITEKNKILFEIVYEDDKPKLQMTLK